MTRTKLLTPDEVAHRLAIARGTVYAAISRGHLDAYRIGRARRISEEQLEDFVNRRNSVHEVDFGSWAGPSAVTK